MSYLNKIYKKYTKSEINRVRKYHNRLFKSLERIKDNSTLLTDSEKERRDKIALRNYSKLCNKLHKLRIKSNNNKRQNIRKNKIINNIQFNDVKNKFIDKLYEINIDELVSYGIIDVYRINRHKWCYNSTIGNAKQIFHRIVKDDLFSVLKEYLR